MKTVVVSGALANKCGNGGAAWTRLSWTLGFRRLGWQVYFVEQILPEACIDAAGRPTDFKDCANLAFFQGVIDQFGLAGAAALICTSTLATAGLSYAELLEVAAEADLLLNISGHLTLEPLLERFRRKAFVDLDPGFTQFWHAAGNNGACLAGHDFYFTVGENIGTAGCPIPTGGIRWRRTRQPVLLDLWPVSNQPGGRQFTTVASWRGPYGSIQHGGTTYGLKAHEFRKLVELPRRAPHEFEIALDIHPADHNDLELLRRYGWRIADARAVAADPAAFRRYVQTSAAEFSVAQGIYVETHSGWFSDRTARYLASGKPALVQDTGFSRNLPGGAGLIPFRTLDEAAAGAREIARNYNQHAAAARALAEELFDSNKVLGRLADEVGLAP